MRRGLRGLGVNMPMLAMRRRCRGTMPSAMVQHGVTLGTVATGVMALCGSRFDRVTMPTMDGRSSMALGRMPFGCLRLARIPF